MQRVENAQYYHAKNSCYLCLQPHDGVDTEIQIDYEGVLFICRGCIWHLARAAGYSVDDDRSAQIDALKGEVEAEKSRADGAEAELQRLALYREKAANLDKGRAIQKAAKAKATA